MERKINKNEILGTSYDARISELKQQISILENEKCEVEEKLSSYMEGLIKTKENGHYNDIVRATYQDLVMIGVGINNIEKVVHTVLTTFTNMNIEFLPKTTFARLMYTESGRFISQLQVSESLLKDYDSSYRTLKFGKHYGTIDVVTYHRQTLIAGIRGFIRWYWNSVLLDILSEIDESLQDTEKNVSNKIISSIKNIMSDRHIVQKKFNSVFQDYRASVLPNVVENWDAMN